MRNIYNLATFEIPDQSQLTGKIRADNLAALRVSYVTPTSWAPVIVMDFPAGLPTELPDIPQHIFTTKQARLIVEALTVPLGQVAPGQLVASANLELDLHAEKSGGTIADIQPRWRVTAPPVSALPDKAAAPKAYTIAVEYTFVVP